MFQLAPDGTGYMVLHSFTGGPGGRGPSVGLTQGPDGTLYGTAGGGASDLGTIFRMAPDGSGFTILHSFASDGDGELPSASLIQGPDGTPYGTTYAGGTFNQGTIFQLAPDGSGFTVLHSFTDGGTDGANPTASLIQGPDGTGYMVLHSSGGVTDGYQPWAGLIQGLDGALYGTTYLGGTSNAGVVFQLTLPSSAPRRGGHG